MLPAAGSGKRMGAGFNKLFLEIGETPILIHTLRVFDSDPACAGILLAVKPEEREQIRNMLERFGITKVKAFVEGGEERQHSVASCIGAHEGAVSSSSMTRLDLSSGAKSSGSLSARLLRRERPLRASKRKIR